MKDALLAALAALSLVAAAPLAQRIGRYDQSKFRVDKPTHLGAGELHYQGLLPADAVHNLSFMHRGVILPKSGIGHHFHNNAEEMFIVWGGSADFTVDGRTSRLRGPVGVPQRVGHSHAIYSPNNVPVEWMNINFRAGSGVPAGAGGRGSGIPSFSADPTAVVNLGGDRSNAPLDPVPVFQYATFYRQRGRSVLQVARLSRRAVGLPAGGFHPSMRGGRECERTVTAAV